MMAGLSLNYLLTSTITSPAAFPTARIDQAAKTKTVQDPIRPPTKISGTVISIVESSFPVNIETSSKKALNKRKQARVADPIE